MFLVTPPFFNLWKIPNSISVGIQLGIITKNMCVILLGKKKKLNIELKKTKNMLSTHLYHLHNS